jgi:exopolyphosphatase/guanosine-5'-triphosphate,3'-diphosphate pyrophosphatase
MRLGVLDVGSNSAQLLVVDVIPGGPPLPAYAIKRPTLLGASFEPDGSIDCDGVRRVVDAVCGAMQEARRCDVEQLYAFGTSALRDATNRDQVVARIEEEAGIRPQFLSGEDEARLTYLAVHHWFGWSAGRLLVLDIGGGSMEIVLGTGAQPSLAVSLPLGAGRLTRSFLPDDPPTRKQVRRLRGHVLDQLHEVADRLRWEGEPTRAVATSKTFKQLARLAGAPPQRQGPFVRRGLAMADLDAWIPRLADASAAERARWRGVSKGRSPQILAGAVVARAAMNLLGVATVDVCPWALREGVVLCHSAWDERACLPLAPISPPVALADVCDIRQLVVGNR